MFRRLKCILYDAESVRSKIDTLIHHVQVPRTSSKNSDGLFYKKQLQQSVAAKKRIEARKQELSALLSSGAAPSFYEKDLERREEKLRRLEAHRNNKNRFQVQGSVSRIAYYTLHALLVNRNS
jgi:uncharacterized protein involved in type VI secretion and phage assembly